MNRTRHLRTDSRDRPVRAVTLVSGATPPSSAQASTNRAGSASACDAVRLRDKASSDARSAGKPGREMTIDFAARQGDCVTRVHVRVESQDGVPEIDTAALAAFITSVFPRNAVEDASATSE